VGRKRAGIAVVLVILCFGWTLSSSGQAQEYRFGVPEVRVVLTVQPDAAVVIEYRMTFQNRPGAHAIDVVDVGMPTKRYEVLGASIDGRPLTSWRPSTYIEAGPEVHLDRYAVPGGSTGIFECRARVPDMIYEDRTDPQRASLRFTPTWFGERYVVGTTDLLLVVKFPQGVHPDSVVWHSDERKFLEKGVLDPDKAAFVSWKERYRLTGPMMFGCSFPRDVMQRVVKAGPLKPFMLWWEQSKRVQQYSGILFLLLFGGCFLLITRGTGITVLLICLVTFIILMVKSPAAHLGLWLLVPVLAGVWYLGIQRRKPHYLPALARVEGGKICRGLTPVEAAILVEAPLHRVFTMVITALLSKGVIRAVQADPLQVERVGTSLAPNAVQLPDGDKVSLEPYEVGFLDTLSAPPAEVAKKDFGEPLKRLVGLVQYKMAGFDADATRAYYRSITARAWDQVSREEDPKTKEDLANRRLNWLFMADDYDRRMEEQRARGWYFDPWWYYPRTYSRERDWARDMARWVAPAAERSSQSIGIHAQGLDLSGVDRFTLQTLSDLAESARSGGSGCVGGGCACACAGCACACACAGGGR
jgi:hypothetical protein